MTTALAAALLAALALAAAACGCDAGAGPAEPPPGTALASSGAAPPGTVVPYPPPEPDAADLPPPAPPLPPEQRELLAAHARYWELYAEALLALDASRLPEVMTGARLERAREEIARLRAAGHAVRLDVESEPVVGMLRGGEAVVIDRYRNQSYLVDAESLRPVSARGVATTVHASFSLVREEGRWKVAESHRREVLP